VWSTLAIDRQTDRQTDIVTDVRWSNPQSATIDFRSADGGRDASGLGFPTAVSGVS